MGYCSIRVGLCGVALTVCGVPAAQAQTSVLRYGFIAPGVAVCCGEAERTGHVGAGVDVLWTDAIGLGGEIGLLGISDSAYGTLSVNVSYHVGRSRQDRLRPFVTAGYTRLFPDAVVNMWNAGVGMHHWFSRDVGLRAEVRDHIYPRQSLHVLDARFGIVVR